MADFLSFLPVWERNSGAEGHLADKNTLASTQEHMDIAEIKEGIVILKNGSMRMVMLASSINFALKSEEEQNAIVMQYQSFLNSLVFPIQIVMQSRRIDLDRYLTTLSDRLSRETNELIQIQTRDYIEFVRRLITIANIMDKKFYIVVPFSPPNMQRRGLFDKIFNPTKITRPHLGEVEFKAYKEEIAQRANVIISGLATIGVHIAALTTQQIVELYYSTYNAEESTKERLAEVGSLDEPMIGKAKEEKGNI